MLLLDFGWARLLEPTPTGNTDQSKQVAAPQVGRRTFSHRDVAIMREPWLVWLRFSVQYVELLRQASENVTQCMPHFGRRVPEKLLNV
jgi:hypothetical protein